MTNDAVGRIIEVAKKNNEVVRERRPPLYIPVERLLLDPENPRLPERAQGGSEEELMKVLAKSFNLDELADSMAENGYFDEEPLVAIVRNVPKKLMGVDPTDSEYQQFLNDPKTRFTVAEGNRRVAAAKLLLNEELRKRLGLRMWPKLRTGVAENLSKLPVIVYSDRSEVVPYLGVRHIMGIQKWDSYARATYVTKMVADGWELSEIQQQIGDRKGAARKIYFCYRLIEEVEDQFDFDTDRAKNYFSYLVLSSGQGAVRDFLGIPRSWAAVDFAQPVPKEKLGDLRKLFSWLFGEGKDKLPVVRESRDITNKLAPILANEEATRHLTLTRDIDDAYERSDGEKELLLKNLKKANKSLERSLSLVPQYKIEEVEKEANRCLDTVRAILKLLED